MRLPLNEKIGLPSMDVNDFPNTVGTEPVVSLASIDLLRGKSLSLPCGIDAALSALGTGDVLPLSAFDLFKNRTDGGADLPSGSLSDVPFLLYVLQEARTQKAGERLGKMGGRIEAEVIIGLLQRQRGSLLNRPKWKSRITCERSVRMVDLVNFIEGTLVPPTIC